MRVSRALARVMTPATPISPLLERARVRALRAKARRCGRDARAPKGANYPVIPAKAGIQKAAVFVYDNIPYV